MAKRFHTALGIFVSLSYLYFVTHVRLFLSQLAGVSGSLAGDNGVPKAGFGLLVIYGLPIAAIVCFIWPERLKWWLSPRPPPEYDYLLTEGVWYLVGYVLLIVSVSIFLLFR